MESRLSQECTLGHDHRSPLLQTSRCRRRSCGRMAYAAFAAVRAWTADLLSLVRGDRDRPDRATAGRREATTDRERIDDDDDDGDDAWRRSYDKEYGTDPLSGDPLDHALLRRMGASWRFMWSCRRPISIAAHDPRLQEGTLIEGERTTPDGTILRGTLCVRRRLRGAAVLSRAEAPISDDDDDDDDDDGSDDRQGTFVLVLEGLGVMIRSDGSMIEGTFHDGVPHGRARSVGAQGEIFGRWRRGRLHGRAVAMTSDGWIVCATWDGGRIVSDYFAQSSHGEQFRCASCTDGRFDGLCRRGYAGGDYALERWSDGRLVGVDRFRIAPVIDSTDLAAGAVIDCPLWVCEFMVLSGDHEGYVYYPSDTTGSEFSVFYDYLVSDASARAFTPAQREAFVRTMWVARCRPSLPSRESRLFLCHSSDRSSSSDDDDDDDVYENDDKDKSY